MLIIYRFDIFTSQLIPFFAHSGGSDYDAESTGYSITGGTQRVLAPVSIIDDNQLENLESIFGNLAGAINYKNIMFRPTTAVANIIDNDSKYITV